MIKISNTEVFGFNKAISSMRNPYESWSKSDSFYCFSMDCDKCPMSKCPEETMFAIGKADMELAKKLIKAGSEHREFLCMIHVQADVVAPRYWWADMDKYKYVEANSSSTMHLITKRPLTLDDFVHDGGTDGELFKEVVNGLNKYIEVYNHRKGEEKEKVFRAIKQILPESYNQLRTIDTNYECLLSIYQQRKNHRLSEWKEFIDWCLTLPYFSEFIGAL